jgi:hypothetical protein
MQLSKGQAYWDDLLDRWNVQTVVVDKEQQKKLLSEVRGSGTWQVVYEDDQGIVAVRRNAIKLGSDKAASASTPSQKEAEKK